LYPKEPFCHYNYALTLLQMGELNEALAAIDVITKKKS
jgi:predicted Zn-dependent protease